jgi:hypothetical protein
MSAKPRMNFSPSTLVANFISCVVVLTACSSKTSPAPPAAETPPAQSAPPATQAAPPSMPAPAVTQASWSPDALEELVAPIALYPDQLVGQILAASVNSQEVLDAGNWLLQNQELKGDALDAAAQKAGLGPAMRALVQFPTIVDMMCQQIDWTRQLGSAFTSDQASVLATVQRLRAQAQQVGNLKSTPQQTVETKTEDKKTVIEIKPANPQIVYVPQYNPQVVYTTPPPAPAPAPVSSSGTVSTEAAVVGGLLAFGLGIAIGNSMNNDCYPHWGAGAVYVGPRPFYPPAYVYRPVYGPAYRPAYGYAPPPGYRNSYNNIHVNGNVNINVNNNYFNQFKNNDDLRRGPNNPRAPSTLPANNWKGHTSYAGARNPSAPTPGGNAALPRASTNPSPWNLANNRPAAAGAAGSRGTPARTKDTAIGNSRPANGAATTNNRVPNQGGNYNRASPNTSQQRPANRAPPTDRGYGSSTPGAAPLGGRDSAARPAPAPAAAGRGDRAFSGAGNGDGGFQRAASARGHASSGAMSGNRGGGGGNRAPRKH